MGKSSDSHNRSVVLVAHGGSSVDCLPYNRRGQSKRSRRARSVDSSGEDTSQTRRDGAKKRVRREREDKQVPQSKAPATAPSPHVHVETNDLAMLPVTIPRASEAASVDTVLLPSDPAGPAPAREVQDTHAPVQQLSTGCAGQADVVDQPCDTMAVDGVSEVRHGFIIADAWTSLTVRQGDVMVEPVNM